MRQRAGAMNDGGRTSCLRRLVALALAASTTACVFADDLRRTDLPARLAEPASSEQVPRRDSERSARATRRDLAAEIDAEVMPLYRAPHPRLRSKARGSAAVGTVTAGFLSRPAEVPIAGPYHEIVAQVASRNTRFTTDEMKTLLLCAAERVGKAHPGHRLALGNLSRMSGGDLPWSVSHNNGRDADIAFYARGRDGKIVHPDFLYRFGRDLVATDGPEPMVFDVAANWALVKALIVCEGSPKLAGAKMDYLFAATWLQRAMLRYATAKDEDRALIARARQLLHQPRRAAAHADHLHLRIGCASDDAHEGCIDKSRAPEEAIGRAAAVRRRLPALRRKLAGASAADRAAAAKLLGLYFDHDARAGLRVAIGDADAAARKAAAAALLRIDARAEAVVVEAALAVEHDASVASAMMHALLEAGEHAVLVRALRDPRTLSAGEPLAKATAGAPPAFDVEAVEIPRAPVVVRAAAAVLLGDSRDLAVARPLVGLLSDALPAVRHAARGALERLTNRSTADLALIAQRDDADDARLWSAFVSSLAPDRDHEQVVLDGFNARGLGVAAVGRAELGSLTSALAWPEPYASNAERLLQQALRYHPEDGRGARAAPIAFWLPWLERRSLVSQRTLSETRAQWQSVAMQQGTEGVAADATAP